MSSNNQDCVILIVDDVPENLQLLSTILTGHGFSVNVARSGQEALASISAKTPNMVFLDVTLPDLSGYDVCAQLRTNAATRDLPIVFLRAPNESRDMLPGLVASGIDYVSLPLRAGEVMARVEMHLEIARLRAGLALQAEELQQCYEKLSIEITERERAEAAMENAKTMEDFGKHVRSIAHDFNNLLNAVIGQSALALGKLPKESLAGSNVSKAMKAAERAADLSHQLLASSGKGKTTTDEIDLNSVVKDIVQMLDVSISKSARLKFEFCSLSPRIRGNVSQIQQAVMNLILNAGEAVGPIPGDIAVRTSRIEVSPHDSFYWKHTTTPLSPGKYALLQVSDTGHGLDPEALEKISDPFYSAQYAGQGFGLPAVLGIVRQHHGGVCITSVEGTGTRIDVVFPLVTASPTTEVSEVQERAQLNGQGKTVLVIDDEPSVLGLLTEIFIEAKFTVLGSLNPREGIELYRKHQQDISIVILDYTMPEMDGKSTFEELTKIHKDVKVLLCSGYAEDTVESSFGVMRPAGFIHKPYQPRELLRRISRVLSGT